jgi:hypothetical protein
VRFDSYSFGASENSLVENGKLKSVVNAIEKAGGTVFVAKKSDEGVRIES